MKDLGSRSLSAVFWGGGGSVIRILLQFVTQVVLARLLGPEQYGLFAIGAIVISFSNFFSDIGIAYGLIQKTEVSERDLRFVFTWQALIGLLVTALVAALSGPIAEFFGDRAARDVVAALAIVCLINALTAPAQNMLKRKLDFKRIQIAQILGYLGGYVFVAIPMALSGILVWSLVAAWIVQVSITLAILYAGAPHSLRPLFWFGDAAQMVRYGATVLITNITNWVIGNIDRVVIGRMFASRDVGLYATAYNIVFSPTSSLLGIVQPVFFSASSRIANERERVSDVYLALIAATVLVVVPMFASASVIAQTFVLALYGARWEAAADLMQPLALAMPLYLIWGLTTPLLWIGGAPEREFKTQWPIALLWVAASLAAAQFSVVAVAWAVAALFGVRCVVIFVVANALIPVPLASLWRAVRGGLMLSTFCAGVAWVLDRWLTARGAPPVIRLLLDLLVCGAMYLAALMWVPGLIASDCAELLERLSARAPRAVGRWLRALPVGRAHVVR